MIEGKGESDLFFEQNTTLGHVESEIYVYRITDARDMKSNICAASSSGRI